MEQDKVPELVDDVKEVDVMTEIQNLIIKYNNDMTTLNRILSTYEDELSSLKNQYHELSFKFKQLTQQLTSE